MHYKHFVVVAPSTCRCFFVANQMKSSVVVHVIQESEICGLRAKFQYIHNRTCFVCVVVSRREATGIRPPPTPP